MKGIRELVEKRLKELLELDNDGLENCERIHQMMKDRIELGMTYICSFDHAENED